MGWWHVNADTLARSRFVVSPLSEALAALEVLHRGTAAHPGEGAWLDTHLPAYRGRLAGDPVTALLIRAAFGRTWTADFLTPPPLGDQSFGEELARIRHTPAAAARADLAVSHGGPLPGELHRDDLPARTADLIEWVWTRTVLPDWPRRLRIIEADIVARTAQLTRGGWVAALDDMRRDMRWLGEGRLQINAYDYPPRDLTGAQLVFVPVTPRWRGWVAYGQTEQHAVIYPCSGVLADVDRTEVPASLERLLGPARAGVLVLLDTPKSTTQLVALTGQGLGSVGRHLRVLLDAQLIRRRRAGKSVLYYRTTVGDLLVTQNGA
ncbi:transcriptional regulator [Actinophytocola sp.]|uniref:ArsR/SmtB family transcription factor n=1 Tax=Actinophytocola sp. TaxID=1872138 RepID=UPI00389A60DA